MINSKQLAIVDIKRAINRQLAWSQEAKEEGEAAIIRAKMEDKKGFSLSARDSLLEAKACFYWSKRRKELAKKYKEELKRILK